MARSRYLVRCLDVCLWLALLALPAIVALAADRELGGWSRVESNFVDALGMERGDRAASLATSSLGEAWYVFFHDLQRLLAMPGLVGFPSCIVAAWFLIAVTCAVTVVGGLGALPGAAALVVLAAHPVTRGIGAALTPWLPAAVFTLVGMAFLHAMALPTMERRRRSAGRVLPRVFAIVGCGLSWGLASSAEARIGWLMLVPGILLLLSIVAVALTLWRLRHRTAPHQSLLVNPWAIVRRTMPWAACWFFVLVLFVVIYDLLLDAQTEGLAAVPPITGFEFGLAWAVLPGLLLLAWREGELLGYRSQLGGRTVLFVCLLAFFLVGPALRGDAGPLERFLQAPALAISVASWLRWRG